MALSFPAVIWNETFDSCRQVLASRVKFAGELAQTKEVGGHLLIGGIYKLFHEDLKIHEAFLEKIISGGMASGDTQAVQRLVGLSSFLMPFTDVARSALKATLTSALGAVVQLDKTPE